MNMPGKSASGTVSNLIKAAFTGGNGFRTLSSPVNYNDNTALKKPLSLFAR